MKQFDVIQALKPKKSAFDLSHRRVTTMNPADLVPVLCHEVLPGDRFKIDLEAFMRTMPLVSPVMHHVNLYAHAFFVPNRILMGEGNVKWEDFITGKEISAELPYWNPSYFHGKEKTTMGNNSLIDHLDYGDYSSIDSETWLGKNLSQMPLRAYHRIWSDYYRDQNHEAEVDFSTDNLDPSIQHSTPNGSEWLFEMRQRCFEKDYFTSAMLTQQRGSAVTMPLSGSAPVVANTELGVVLHGTNTPVESEHLGASGDGLLAETGSWQSVDISGMEADLSQATSSTISQLRQAFALQRWYEASMRFGQRYVEQLLGLFGVVSKDARLQRAEFLAGGKLPVQIGEVLQTSETNTSPQGTMAGRAISTGYLCSIDRTFDEHGWLMIIVSCIPRTAYINHCHRSNLKIDRFDFAFPQFAHLSEQPVYNQELVQLNETAMGTAFGYQPIYSEYRYIPDTYHGEMKDSLAFWGLGRKFIAVPPLDLAFVRGSFPQEIFATTTQEQPLLLQTYAKVLAIRPLPKHGTPI